MIPLSYAQRRLWFLYRLEGPSATYNVPLALRLDGPLDAEAMSAAVVDVVARHESLRTVFPAVDGVPRQDIRPAERVTGLLNTVAVAAADLEAALEEAARYAFALETELPFRATLFRVDGERDVLLLVLHHIVADGWSAGPMLRDLSQAYAARLGGCAPGWDALDVQYADYALWEREVLGSEDDPDSLLSRQVAYWREQLAGVPELVELPLDRPRPAVASHAGDEIDFLIPAGVHRSLSGLAAESGSTMFMVLHAALAALLTRHGAGTDVPVGTVVAGRSDEALEDLVGFFVNTLVLRTDTSGDPSFRELLERVREVDLAAFAHQDVPFERLVEVVNPVRSLAHHPLFQVMLVLQNNAEGQLALPGVTGRVEDLAVGTAKFDLTFTLHERHTADGTPDGLAGSLTYATDVFDRGSVEVLVGRLVRLLESVAGDPGRPVGEWDVLAPGERARLLEEWNDTGCEVPAGSLVELFEERVRCAPGAVAVEFGELALSYGEVNARANRLARCLVGVGVGPERRVAVALPRSVDWLVAVLAVMKAGGAYVPVDPDYPRDRIGYMLADAEPVCTLATAATAGVLPEGVSPILVEGLELGGFDAADLSDAERLAPLLVGSPAYVIYTSGSTGRPKGVVVTHAGIADFAYSQIRSCDVTEDSRVLKFASPSFDATVWELVLALLSGARLVLAPAEELLPGEPLAGVLARHGVTHALLPPAALAVLPDDGLPDGMTLVVGGEACPPAMVGKWSRGRRMINAYGPTEATVVATMSGPLSGAVTPPIGTPLPNSSAYVLDSGLRPVPVGCRVSCTWRVPGWRAGIWGVRR
ncbi:condensation domain-containing protein [Streptomyces sp. XD-27]|uniref:non-ribosomal peptide synthetase n=1 Tax=Streptomyces sp. XD-27 TaxID=3062779 RepID=UPI0026F45D04|nr:condensation domain-containing protein [Streptomyces sp. XD-27]WKX69505.1 condensation domain-containing protein [Streptomyces sp. XD-27]